MSATGRIALAAAVACLGCVLFAPAAGADPDNGLACELVSLAKVEKTFGLPHAVFRPKATSPTAPAPNNHTVDGSDKSECDVYVYNATPSPTELLGLARSAGKPNVPAGIGSVIVTTYVRDSTNAGDSGAHWAPDRYFGYLLRAQVDLGHEYGGDALTVPKYGGEQFAGWIGNTNHAVGIWQIGGSVIAVNVIAAGGTAPSKLTALAKLIVPKFAPFAGS